MSAPTDAAEFAQLVVRVGIVDDNAAKECLYELEDRTRPPVDMAKLLERKGLITPFQSSKLVKGDMDGYILGGFRLLYKIASGSFGRVYRGDDPRTGQIVAVKVLRRRWTEDKKRVEMFEREGRIGQTMQHPNIVQILAVSKDQTTGQYFIVMEFVEGGNLRDILSIRKKLEPAEALHVIEECAAGLAYAQTRGLTHRDIKPTNILISTDKIAKLVDFGLAEISQGAALMTSKEPGHGDDEVDRTVDYAGLEKLTGSKKGDPRSDIYFLGIVLFEIMTGHALLPRTRDKQVMQMRTRYELDDTIRKLGIEYDLPGNVISLILRMCAFEPSARYQTPAMMHEGVKTVEAELKGGSAGTRSHQASGPLTIFIAEDHQKLQDVFRQQFKKLGFRVLISIDPSQALTRFKQQPYHALIIDVGTVGREGIESYEKVLREADLLHLDFAAVLIFNEDQKGFASSVREHRNGVVFVRPVTMKQLSAAIRDRLNVDGENHDEEGEAE
ncbi:serine/threonine-protein kinase [Limnoglobus roseus]|uniref:Serine/threonine protein kinase n=1 Tax=Limnoglobus roseus TaxID=2598579 RepID=A0A5C1AIX5_9BACT|nr:serine/threonine-protein kinase [Limnoglobus roseus]QEL18097.1 serine/threonine protein kinase [Limnoglobus roseus]